MILLRKIKDECSSRQKEVYSLGFIYRYLSENEQLKMSVIVATEIVQRAKEIHACSPTATAALGRLLCAASMMGNSLKNEASSITITVDGGGPIGKMTAVSDSIGNVRCFAMNPNADLPSKANGKLDVGGLVGNKGLFTVIKDLGMKKPYIGSVEIVTGEIAEDLTEYYHESEQTPTACGLGVLVGTDCNVAVAGGFLVQLMPGASNELTSVLERNIAAMYPVTRILTTSGYQGIAEAVLRGIPNSLLTRERVNYKCYCSREKVTAVLRSIGKKEIENMIRENRTFDVHCQFCDSVYSYTKQDLQNLLHSEV